MTKQTYPCLEWLRQMREARYVEAERKSKAERIALARKAVRRKERKARKTA